MRKGEFIVLYGINNLGKTVQAKKLVERIKKEGYEVEYLKYPIYDLSPSGPLIDSYLREGDPHNLSVREAQLLYAQNRTQFEPQLVEKLESGVWIIAEDYTGTSFGWGGLDNLYFLMDVNSHLLKEDVAILLDGERFTDGIESSHAHESDNERTNSVRDIFKQLAKARGWFVVNANQSIEEVHERIFECCCLVSKELRLI